MTSPFLLGFTRAVLARLIEAGQLDVEAGDEEEVALFVAERLEAAGQGAQAVSTLVKALLDCPEVVELYAEDSDVMRVMENLGRFA